VAATTNNKFEKPRDLLGPNFLLMSALYRGPLLAEPINHIRFMDMLILILLGVALLSGLLRFAELTP